MLVELGFRVALQGAIGAKAEEVPRLRGWGPSELRRISRRVELWNFGIHTMVWDRVDPFVERRVEFGDNLLLPFLPHEAEEDLRLVDGVLE